MNTPRSKELKNNKEEKTFIMGINQAIRGSRFKLLFFLASLNLSLFFANCSDESNNTNSAFTGEVNSGRDGSLSADDLCPDLSYEVQKDMDGDEIGDDCDNDIDGDNVSNRYDCYPYNSAYQDCNDRKIPPCQSGDTTNFTIVTYSSGGECDMINIKINNLACGSTMKFANPGDCTLCVTAPGDDNIQVNGITDITFEQFTEQDEDHIICGKTTDGPSHIEISLE